MQEDEVKTEVKTESATLEVMLRIPHTHAGKFSKAGEIIDVTPAQAKWLLKRGIIHDLETN